MGLTHVHVPYYEHVTYERPYFHSNISQFTFLTTFRLFRGQIQVLLVKTDRTHDQNILSCDLVIKVSPQRINERVDITIAYLSFLPILILVDV